MRGEEDLRGEVSHEAKECESMRGDVRKLKGEWKRDESSRTCNTVQMSKAGT